jgi:hypothetical protein
VVVGLLAEETHLDASTLTIVLPMQCTCLLSESKNIIRNNKPVGAEKNGEPNGV